MYEPNLPSFSDWLFAVASFESDFGSFSVLYALMLSVAAWIDEQPYALKAFNFVHRFTLSFSNIFLWFCFWFWIFFGIVICIAIVIGYRRWFFDHSFCEISGGFRLSVTWLGCPLSFRICRAIRRTIFLRRIRNRFFNSIGRSRLRPFLDRFYEVTAMWNPSGCYPCCHWNGNKRTILRTIDLRTIDLPGCGVFSGIVSVWFGVFWTFGGAIGFWSFDRDGSGDIELPVRKTSAKISVKITVIIVEFPSEPIFEGFNWSNSCFEFERGGVGESPRDGKSWVINSKAGITGTSITGLAV